MKNREVKIKRELAGLFFKAITVSIDDIDKFEQMKWRIKDLLKTLGMIG